MKRSHHSLSCPRPVDISRYNAVREALTQGHRTSGTRERDSVFDIASRSLAGTSAAGSPSTMRRAFYRIRKNGKDSELGDVYAQTMQDEHEKPVVLTVRVKPTELEALRRVALSADRSMSSVMRLALRKVLEEHHAGMPELRA